MKKIDIHPTALLGQPIRPLQGMILSKENPSNTQVTYGQELYIGPYSIIGEGAVLGNKVIIDAF